MAQIDFNGIGENVYTFPANVESAKKGDVVCLAYSAAKMAEENQDFCGICVSMRNDMPFQMSVQMSGFAKVKYSGAAPSCGYVNLVGDGNGGVKVGNEAGRKTLVIDINSSEHTLLIYFN